MPIVLPTGFILLASYDERVGQEHKSGPKGDYAKILRELAKDTPSIAAYKDCGQWVAREADVIKFLASAHRQQEKALHDAIHGKGEAPDILEVVIDKFQVRMFASFLGVIVDRLDNLAKILGENSSERHDKGMSHGKHS